MTVSTVIMKQPEIQTSLKGWWAHSTQIPNKVISLLPELRRYRGCNTLQSPIFFLFDPVRPQEFCKSSFSLHKVLEAASFRDLSISDHNNDIHLGQKVDCISYQKTSLGGKETISICFIKTVRN